MANTSYTDGVTGVTADTMNDLNRLHYTILSDPTDAAAVRTALGVAALGVTAGTAVQVDQAVTATTRSATTTLGTTLNHTLSDTSTTITAFNGVTGVTYHCRALGAGSITHHATNLIITQGSADLTTAAGMTFDVEMITSTTCRIKNVHKADGTALVAAASATPASAMYNATNTYSLTSTTAVDVTGATVNITTTGGNLLVTVGLQGSISGGQTIALIASLDSVDISPYKTVLVQPTYNQHFEATYLFTGVSAAAHTVKIRSLVNAGTFTTSQALIAAVEIV